MQLNDEIARSKQLLFLTGAGVSTASGIPDYRSKNGLYAGKESPEYLLSLTCLKQQPELFYRFVSQKMYYPAAQPNIIHRQMALATQKRRAGIITQNVDGLHTKAGAKNVIEFHGNLYHVTCQRCGQKVPYTDYLNQGMRHACGGILRPEIVLYEEQLAPEVVEQAVAAVVQADLIIVCGTSLQVYPFAGLLDYRRPDAHLIAINREQLKLPQGSRQLRMDAATVFAQLIF
ncbi:NAD-dependent protein deacylase [Liquorilactobacillus satsumensis]|uniref:NAD-dependent protein deacylase n=1 Tax=Liquorilactobacillus satsumensis TaxID=259059 RepID=UPI0021C38BD2|nr:NAD-dependent protein deacylase [Liquorilactobacillus satsumensis]MCP9313284.1 NAD-dependent protein deacylase [Liquorilactobacillus satsumensis]MCP9360466.1 NAD-dependent protein deacylase [Liquorilactobacillus satsumensis]